MALGSRQIAVRVSTPPRQNVGYISISLTTRSCHFVQSSPLDAFESVKLCSDLPDQFFGGEAFYVLMYEYVPYLGWGLIRNPQVAKKGSFCVLTPFEAI
jgi:hypothetical protein